MGGRVRRRQRRRPCGRARRGLTIGRGAGNGAAVATAAVGRVGAGGPGLSGGGSWAHYRALADSVHKLAEVELPDNLETSALIVRRGVALGTRVMRGGGVAKPGDARCLSVRVVRACLKL